MAIRLEISLSVLSQRDAHAGQRDQTGTSGCISALTEQKFLAPEWASTPKPSAGDVGWPHRPGLSQGLIETEIEVLEEFMGTIGHTAVLERLERSPARFWGENNNKTHKKSTQTSNKTKQKTL